MCVAWRAYQLVTSELNESHQETIINSTQLMHWDDSLCKWMSKWFLHVYLAIERVYIGGSHEIPPTMWRTQPSQNFLYASLHRDSYIHIDNEYDDCVPAMNMQTVANKYSYDWLLRVFTVFKWFRDQASDSFSNVELLIAHDGFECLRFVSVHYLPVTCVVNGCVNLRVHGRIHVDSYYPIEACF